MSKKSKKSKNSKKSKDSKEPSFYEPNAPVSPVRDKKVWTIIRQILVFVIPIVPAAIYVLTHQCPAIDASQYRCGEAPKDWCPIIRNFMIYMAVFFVFYGELAFCFASNIFKLKFGKISSALEKKTKTKIAIQGFFIALVVVYAGSLTFLGNIALVSLPILVGAALLPVIVQLATAYSEYKTKNDKK